ncbi:hypothetical protein CK203_006152 [Vitis vinifera]|uniref:Uncharacterized protein n=1 Tax=Vitis vinifera TaxID=29760 RepID=A0A438K5T6_VITVI|nr:hypothetical protein CK203_006152 [Vitis vinifera]
MARCVCTNLDEQRLEVAVESDTTPLSLIHFSERLADAGDDPLLQSSVPRLCCWLTFSLDALVEGAAVVVIYLKSPLYLEMGMVSFALHLGNRHLALGKVLCQTCGTFYNYGMVHNEEMKLWEVMGRRDGRMRFVGISYILYDSWSPAMTVSSICISILSMLSSSTVKVLVHLSY